MIRSSLPFPKSLPDFMRLFPDGAENESPTYAELYSGDWQHPNQVDAPLIDPASVIK